MFPVLLFLVCALSFGALAGIGGAVLYRRRLRPRFLLLPPGQRSRLLIAASGAPLLVGVCMATAMVGPALVAGLGLGEGHCHGHGETAAGFFLAHPPLEKLGTGLWFLVGGLSLPISIWLAARLRRTARVLRLHATLVKASRREHGDYRTLPITRPLALCVGILRPAVLISSGLIERLSPAQLHAVVAHESSHAFRRDALWQAIAWWLSCLHLPRTRTRLRSDLLLADEQCCDERAARAVGDRVLVAETILAVKRMLGTGPTMVVPTAPAFAERHCADRIRSLVAGEPRRRRAPSLLLAWSAIPIVLAVSTASFFLAETSPFCC